LGRQDDEGKERVNVMREW